METTVSAEQPALSTPSGLELLTPAENLNVPSSTTPLYAKVVANLAALDPNDVDHSALDDVEKTFMFGDIMETPIPGHWGEKPMHRL